mmetsp:Transcript_124594/g.338462  ORF Transcript_124594/g.338462 Transcript_124594/m.338462 type:complete len:116 (-) Transcript_124594:104-451(-)
MLCPSSLMAGDGAGATKSVDEAAVIVDVRTLNTRTSRKPPLIPVNFEQRVGTTATTKVCDAKLSELDSGNVQTQRELPKGLGARGGGDLVLTSRRLLLHAQLQLAAGGRHRPKLT